MKLFKKVVLTGALVIAPLMATGVASAASVSYKAGNGDTLYKIAQWNKISLSSLKSANPQLANPNVIWPGMRINIPVKGGSAPTATSVSSYAQSVFNLVNQQRANAGLSPLTLNGALSGMALDKAIDMERNNYFSHTSPTYGSPFDMMKRYGIPYSYAGENIAKGQQSPQQVMNDWMNSAGHRANILNPNYKKIGVGYYNGEWVQEFTG